MQWLSRLVERAEDWRYLIQRKGYWSALPVVTREVATLPYRHMEFSIVDCSLLEPLPDLPPKIDLETREFKSSDLALVQGINSPSEIRLCAQRLAYNHKGLLALYKDQPVGYAWATSEEGVLERVHLGLSNGDVLCTDAYTVPEFRRRGIQTALVLARFRLLGSLGYKRAIAYIETSNAPSLAVWHKVGGHIVGHFHYKRVGPWCWINKR